MITIDQVREARTRIAPYIRETPFMKFDYLGPKLGKDIFLKCESLQVTGSFKLRGATNMVMANLPAAKKNGVVAASAGNHAQGVAAICNFLKIPATIVMPTSTPHIKVQNTRAWGANVELVGTVYDESSTYARELSDKKGMLYVHPFNDLHVMAGQGTTALEMCEHPLFKEVEAVAISIGGGGLMTGCATVLKALRPDIKIYGVCAKNAPSVWRSFKEKRLVEEPVLSTLAEGVATKRPDPKILASLSNYLTDYFAISEESIAYAIALQAEHGKLISEGAGALPLAAVLEGLIPEKKVALVVSGGNIDLTALGNVLQRGLAEQSRLVRLIITIPDRPGGLNSVTTVLAESGANILQVFHQRAALHTRFGEAEIEVELDTRGKEHTEATIQALTGRGFSVRRVG